MIDITKALKIIDEIDDVLQDNLYYGLDDTLDELRARIKRQPDTKSLKFACPRCWSQNTTCHGVALDIDMSKRWTGARQIDEYSCRECNNFWFQLRETD